MRSGRCRSQSPTASPSACSVKSGAQYAFKKQPAKDVVFSGCLSRNPCQVYSFPTSKPIMAPRAFRIICLLCLPPIFFNLQIYKKKIKFIYVHIVFYHLNLPFVPSCRNSSPNHDRKNQNPPWF